ncbi:hypothetical protein AMATHDRAFT_55017 [Amanita thiersii Skay4041]|uniref:F-box domain-containing protein n=1 Tax=Amanita thiersii Skay4041 TaxID=703135 RepID=A0A2A9NXT0_9AGAR|nr:hypothetical protein AMATHDRAFT_55017 [Amanita thiersii Skay4041]
MRLSLEAYRMIVNNIGNRADLASLCIVSKEFRYVAERALYNTIYVRDARQTRLLCETLALQTRLSIIVQAFTIYLDQDNHDDGHSSDGVSSTPALPDSYWDSVAGALRSVNRLHHLSILLSGNVPTSNSWVLQDCRFQLKSFHCDLDWDVYLVNFLNTQSVLEDLYILDYPTGDRASVPYCPSLAPCALRKLSRLECTYLEVAASFVPGRPVTYLKTCFSRTKEDDKRAELSILLSGIKGSTSVLHSLDIADSEYSEAFSMEVLKSITETLNVTELRYIGTLVLPIDGKKRLQFYGLLMRLPRIQCVEVDVSEWEPAPINIPALRALAGELRLYNPTIFRVVFVYEFERTVVTAKEGVFRHDITTTDDLWREV